MAKQPGFTAHQDEPRTLGGRLPGILADILAHDTRFLDALAQQRPLTFEGTVTALQRDNTGVNRVQVQRTGQAAAEAAWYTVWGTFYVPVVGDQVRLLLVGRGAAVLLGAKHGGRPNEWTVAYSGGALHKYDAGRLHIHKHGDDHHHRHYQTDGTTIAHHHSATGQHAHVGDHVMGGGGGLAIGDTGSVSGTYHKKTHNNSRYEHYQGTTLVRHHSTSGDHGHYASGTLIHQILLSGTGGSVKMKQHGTASYHQLGDDGAGNLAHVHAAGGNAWKTDGTQHLWYTNTGGGGSQVTMKHVAVGTQAGQIQVQRNNTSGSYHTWGDNGGGTVQMVHGLGSKAIMDHDSTSWQHYVNGNVAHKATVGALGAGIYSHHFFHSAVTSADTELAIIDVAGTTGAAGGGRLRLKQYNGAQPSTLPHVVGDDGAGNMTAYSQSSSHTIALSAGAATHTHTAAEHTFPSGVHINAPTTDGSVINHYTAANAGAIKRQSHSTTPQVVGTGSATITTDNNIAHYVFPAGANGDPHLKLIMACVWDSGLISNPGLYTFSPSCPAGTTKTYSNYLYNTSGGGANTSYLWGCSALSTDSQAWIYATQLGGAGNKTVGTALWVHVVN